jgi:hypothetical protein
VWTLARPLVVLDLVSSDRFAVSASSIDTLIQIIPAVDTAVHDQANSQVSSARFLYLSPCLARFLELAMILSTIAFHFNTSNRVISLSNSASSSAITASSDLSPIRSFAVSSAAALADRAADEAGCPIRTSRRVRFRRSLSGWVMRYRLSASVYVS